MVDEVLTFGFLKQLPSLRNKQWVPPFSLVDFGLAGVELLWRLRVLSRGVLFPDRVTALRQRTDRSGRRLPRQMVASSSNLRHIDRTVYRRRHVC